MAIYNTYGDFNTTDEINNPSWQRRRIYDNAPYLIVPNSKIYLKLSDLLSAPPAYNDNIPVPYLIPETVISSIPFSKTFLAPIVIEAIGFESTINQTINIGTTNGGTNVVNAYNILANEGNFERIDYFILTDTTLYFTGITGSLTLKIWYKNV